VEPGKAACLIARDKNLIRIVDADGMDPLMLITVKNRGELAAVTKERENIANYILSVDPDRIYVRDSRGSNALAYAAINDADGVARIILETDKNRLIAKKESLANKTLLNQMDNYKVTPYKEADMMDPKSAAVLKLFEDYARENGIKITVPKGILPPNAGQRDMAPDGSPQPDYDQQQLPRGFIVPPDRRSVPDGMRPQDGQKLPPVPPLPPRRLRPGEI
jgi:hypothetical protein